MEGQVVNDIVLYDRSAYENVNAHPKNGVLRTIEGPVAEWGKLNRNKRMYTERLWDNVLESSYVKEQLSYHTLYGEANHPPDRYEVDFERVSHSIIKMWKVPDRDQIYATIQILDTPFGRILDTLYEAGGVIGYSSRAGGNLIQRKDHVDVDEKSYNFITFDAVPFPSVEAARPGAITEGTVELATLSKEAHDSLCKIIESANSSTKQALKDFIYSLEGYDMSIEKKLFEEAVPASSPVLNAQPSEDETTLSLLKESALQIDTLKAANQTLIATKDSLIRENEGLKTSLNSSLNRVTELLEECRRLESKIRVPDTSLDDAIRKKDERISELETELLEQREEIESYQSLNEAARALRQENEMLKREHTISNASNAEFSAMRNRVTSLESQLSEAYAEISSMIEEISEKDSSISEMEAEQARLLEANDDLVREKKRLIAEQAVQAQRDETVRISKNQTRELEAENARLTNQVESLTESAASIREAAETYKRELISTISGGYNLTVEQVIPLLKAGFTKSDIYNVCESLSNSSKIAYPTIVSESVSSNIPVKPSNVGLYFGGNRRGKGIK